MKTKTKLLALLCAFSINVGAAEQAASGFTGEVGIGYASDYFYRGVQVAEESTQIKARLSTDLSIADGFICAFVNQGLQSVDSYLFAAGLSDSYLNDSVTTKVGYLHREDTPGEAADELFVSAGLNIPLNPVVTISQDLNDDLTTAELGLSHVFDLDIVSLDITGNVGNTETVANTWSYYNVGAGLSRSFGDLVARVGVDHIDAEDADEETVFSAGVTVKF
jgi:hypothetical protein